MKKYYPPKTLKKDAIGRIVPKQNRVKLKIEEHKKPTGDLLFSVTFQKFFFSQDKAEVLYNEFKRRELKADMVRDGLITKDQADNSIDKIVSILKQAEV